MDRSSFDRIEANISEWAVRRENAEEAVKREEIELSRSTPSRGLLPPPKAALPAALAVKKLDCEMAVSRTHLHFCNLHTYATIEGGGEEQLKLDTTHNYRFFE